MWVIVLWKWGYSMPDDADGGVVEYNWIFKIGQAIPCIRAVSLRFKTSYTAPGLTIWIQFKIIK